MENKIIDAYMNYVLENGEQPASVYAFAKKLKIKEGEFYQYFSSFEAIENDFAMKKFHSIIETLHADTEIYGKYGAKEKFSALLYSWTQTLRDNRSFVQFLEKKEHMAKPIPGYFKSLKEDFHKWADSILAEGIENNEVVSRQFISDRYADALFLQFTFIHKFWLKDNSKDFEKTDAAIEKSVRLAFDLIGQSAFDSALDFGKFIFSNRS
jgi:hypothetical protein